jgi:hypothetical protein
MGGTSFIRVRDVRKLGETELQQDPVNLHTVG